MAAAADWAPRLWHSTLVYRDHLWVLAGVNQSIVNQGDVWCTRDGRNWIEVRSDKIWSPRHAQAAFAHGDRIVVAAGHARPVNSEVWSLTLPPNFFSANTGAD